MGANNPYSLSFNGTSDYINCGNDSSLNTVNAVTVEMWVKSSSIATHQQVTYRGAGAGIRRDMIDIYTSKVRFGVANGGDFATADIVTGSTTLLSDTWYHIAGVFNGSTIKVYVNGSEDGSKSKTSKPTSSNEVVYIGSLLGTSVFFNGLIDEARRWNIARTPEQIADNYKKRLKGDESGLIAYWRMDTGSGSTAYDSAGSNDGTIYGASWSTDTPSLNSKGGFQLWWF